MSTKQNNANVLATCKQRLDALAKHVSSTRSKTEMEINGTKTTLATVLSVYQTAIDTRGALIAHRAAYDQALSQRDDAEDSRVATDAGLQAWVITKFGAGSPEAQEFGFVPRKVTPRSAETKADAVKLALETRKARHTMGKRQKKGITGAKVAPTEPADPAPPAPPGPSGMTSGAANGSGTSNGGTAH